MGKEVTVAGASAVPATIGEGAFASLDSRDIILPVITLRNNSYRNEELEDFKPGDVIKRPDNIVLADKKKTCDFVVLSISKCWRIMDCTTGEVKWLRNEPVGARDVPLEWTVGPQVLRRDYTFVCHILTVEELRAQAKLLATLEKGGEVEPDDFVLPSRISFSRSSSQAGKEINLWAELCRAMNGQPISRRIFSLSSESRTNDKGNWVVFKVVKATDPKTRTLDKALQPAALYWENTLKQKTYAAHEEEVEVDEVVVDAGSAASDEIPF